MLWSFSSEPYSRAARVKVKKRRFIYGSCSKLENFMMTSCILLWLFLVLNSKKCLLFVFNRIFVIASKQNFLALCLNSRKFSFCVSNFSIYWPALFPWFSPFDSETSDHLFLLALSPSSKELIVASRIYNKVVTFGSPIWSFACHLILGSSVVLRIEDAKRYLIGASVGRIITFSMQLLRLLRMSLS